MGLQILLAEVSASQGQTPLAELPLFTYQHQLRVLHPAAISQASSGFESIQAAVHRQAAQLPAGVAFAASEYCSGQSRSQLLRSSACCSALLRSHGIPAGSCTAMQLPGPGIEAALGLLTILNNGGSVAFLPSGGAAAGQQQLPEGVSVIIDTSKDNIRTTSSPTVRVGAHMHGHMAICMGCNQMIGVVFQLGKNPDCHWQCEHASVFSYGH